MFSKLQNSIKIEEESSSKKELIIYLFVAYFFSVILRYYWIYMLSGNSNFFWNGELMINTNDGYAWAEGARDIINGGSDPFDGSAVSQPISIITATLITILPFKLETIILWMPAIFGSLLTVPVLLIGHLLKQVKVGFIAALLSGIAWSYYNRTMMGYYDTDLLVIVLPTFVLWSILFAIHSKDNNRFMSLFLVLFFTILYRWYYSGSFSLLVSMTFMTFVYTLIFDRKNTFNYKLIFFFLLAISTTISFIIVVVAMLFLLLFYFAKDKVDKFIFPLIGIVIFYMLYDGAFQQIMIKLEQYVIRQAIADDIKLKFFSVVQTVREAGAIPFDLFANRISGHIVTFVFSLLGFLLLLIKHPKLIIALPMVGLGFLAYKNGLRFTVYAVPIMALGISFFIVYLASFFKGYIRVGFLVLTTAAILYPNVKHIQDYMVPTVFTKQEVEVLDKLGEISTSEDYTVTWWDYGFPIRFYSNTKTLIDGGKHDGFQNFAPSLILTSTNQTIAAKMARLEVEYIETKFKEGRLGEAIGLMSKDFNFKEPESFLKALPNLDISSVKRTRDIYIYLPNRLMNILPTVALFSNMNIVTGEQYNRGYYSVSNGFNQSNGIIKLVDGSRIEQNKGIITLQNGQKIPIKDFYTVSYDRNFQINTKKMNVRKDGYLSIIYLQSYKKMIVVDSKMLNSTFIQLYFFENYDRNLFELVIKNPYAKVYKLKI